ncbi:MAG TPA: AbrB/MazE/SpoVT family DNA-binding domain-containing protein [Mesorhizobium sp.]|jgi:AbrB family looped-hinge helix DNA binding protein|nr:AbrB/MazE/SpoVT family DNA-binding domain-containing protein [Mesorhizobium sp.]
MFATITSKGQLTLPKAVRDKLALRAGDRLLLTVVDDHLVGIPQNFDFEQLAGILGDPPGGPATLKEIDEAVAEAVGRSVAPPGDPTRENAA